MHEIPPAKDTDAEDVAWGLQTAASLWKRGERSDAVAWLRRAAQAASDAQDDDRALELARLAAELADWVGTQGTMMPSARESAVDEIERTALDARPPADEPLPQYEQPDAPVSSHQPSVPPAEKVHAGMFDPWSEPPPPPANVAVPPPAPAIIDIPKAPITQPMFGEEEVVTSAKAQAMPAQALPSRPAPPKPPPLPPAASRKPPPPLPPRAMAKPPASPALQAPTVIPEPPPPTPVPPSPTEQHMREEEDEASMAQTTPPPPVEALAAFPAIPHTQPLLPEVPDEPEAPEVDDMAQTPIAPAVASRVGPDDSTLEPSQVPEQPAAAASNEKPVLDLEDVDAFSDLPDDARAAFAAAAEVNVLAETDEIAGFALAYVMEGSCDVAATMVDAPAVRLAAGAVLRSRGTTNEGVPMRIIAASSRAVVASWSTDAVEAAFSNCPWVEEDLRAASDRVMTLVGITIGPLGERLDQSLREEIVGRLTVRPLIPGEVVVNKGEPVPGLLLVGVGEIELVDGDDVKGIVGSGDFLFATEVLSQGAAPFTARAGAGGALAMFGNRSIAQELMVTCPPLLEVFAGM